MSSGSEGGAGGGRDGVAQASSGPPLRTFLSFVAYLTGNRTKDEWYADNIRLFLERWSSGLDARAAEASGVDVCLVLSGRRALLEESGLVDLVRETHDSHPFFALLDVTDRCLSDLSAHAVALQYAERLQRRFSEPTQRSGGGDHDDDGDDADAAPPPSYRHFCFVNASCRGPFLHPALWDERARHWSCVLTDRLDEPVASGGAELGLVAPVLEVPPNRLRAIRSPAAIHARAASIRSSRARRAKEIPESPEPCKPEPLLLASSDLAWEMVGPGAQLPFAHTWCFALSRAALEHVRAEGALVQTGLSYAHAVYAERAVTSAVIRGGLNVASLLPHQTGVDWRDAKEWDGARWRTNLVPTHDNSDPENGFFDSFIHPFQSIFVKAPSRALPEPVLDWCTRWIGPKRPLDPPCVVWDRDMEKQQQQTRQRPKPSPAPPRPKPQAPPLRVAVAEPEAGRLPAATTSTTSTTSPEQQEQPSQQQPMQQHAQAKQRQEETAATPDHHRPARARPRDAGRGGEIAGWGDWHRNANARDVGIDRKGRSRDVGIDRKGRSRAAAPSSYSSR